MKLTDFAESYPARKERLSTQMKSASGNVRLAKTTSNLFRDRADFETSRLTVRDFNHLLTIDKDQQTLTAEGMITYADLVDATLEHGFIPMVVPQLKSITIGGAIAGVGIESTSFRFGLPHETVLEMDVLLADGSVVTCTADNEYSDLYYGMANSYGTLGYTLRLKTPALPVKPYVRLEHERFSDLDEFFNAIQQISESDIDFLDGTVFQAGEFYLTTGRFCESAPFTSDYTYLNIYYRSIREKRTDYLTIKDYIWRWDTDWFWCSKNLYAQNGLVRRVAGKKRLNSETYTKVMRWNTKWGVTGFLNRLAGYHNESVIQDIDIPIDRASEFLEFLLAQVGVLPIWICPIGTTEKSARFPLFPLSSEKMYVNFGFWDSVRSRQRSEPGHLNRKIEVMTAKLGGIKSLYSDSYFDKEEFWQTYNSEDYWKLKKKYDRDGRFLDLYEKCVLRQ
ncbi:MAG: FAD-binding oxidoreductase [Acidiferrobacterales bacterium]|nr:FAD-binding oxidoreductase [Acidiferrobacterales bacterium]